MAEPKKNEPAEGSAPLKDSVLSGATAKDPTGSRSRGPMANFPRRMWGRLPAAQGNTRANSEHPIEPLSRHGHGVWDAGIEFVLIGGARS
jgi:hypothetical protein